tara:strand:- start:257 stop:445 length:189 start_codon:yes stop_codon:yes gene_type:complete
MYKEKNMSELMQWVIGYLVFNFALLVVYMQIVVMEETKLGKRIPLIWEKGFDPKNPFKPLEK